MTLCNPPEEKVKTQAKETNKVKYTSCEGSMLNRGKWSEEEAKLFEECIEKHGKDWMKIEEQIPTRDLSQIKSHAQKYFKKMAQKAVKKGKKLKLIESPIVVPSNPIIEPIPIEEENSLFINTPNCADYQEFVLPELPGLNSLVADPIFGATENGQNNQGVENWADILAGEK